MPWSDKVKNDALVVSLHAIAASEVNEKGYTSWVGETKLHRHLLGDLSVNGNISQGKKKHQRKGKKAKFKIPNYPGDVWISFPWVFCFVVHLLLLSPYELCKGFPRLSEVLQTYCIITGAHKQEHKWVLYGGATLYLFTYYNPSWYFNPCYYTAHKSVWDPLWL